MQITEDLYISLYTNLISTNINKYRTLVKAMNDEAYRRKCTDV